MPTTHHPHHARCTERERRDRSAATGRSVAARAAFAGLGAFGKYLIAQGLDPLQVIFLRNFLCVLMLMPLLMLLPVQDCAKAT